MSGDLPKGVAQDEKGEPKLPQERFSSALEVQETCAAMIDADSTVRAPRRARVDGIVNGNRPVSQRALAKKNFGWMPNCNYLEAEGFLQASQTPLFDLVTETDHVVDITLDSGRVKGSAAEIDAWENQMQIDFTWLMKVRWRKGFNYHIGFQQLQMLKHGLGAHVRPTNSWIPRTPRAGSVLFPTNAPINFEEDGEYYMLRDFLPGHALHRFIRNEKAARSLGWNPKAVWKALAQSSKSKQAGRKNSVADVQRDIRNGDIGWSQSRQAGVWLNYLFVREIDNEKWSLYVVTEAGGGANVKDYLFKKRNAYDDSRLDLFNYDIGDGDLNSLRGLGERTATFFELSNRLKNAMAAQVLISMFPQIKQTREDVDPDKLKLMRMGALSILPYGAEPSLIQFPPLNNGPLALSRELRQTMESNNQSTIGSGTPEPKDRETALSFSMRAHDQARVSNGLQSLYESNLQGFYDRTLKMVLDMPKVGGNPASEMAEELRQRCLKHGVPKEALKSEAIAEVQEVTSSGSGSAAARLQGLMTLMNLVFPNTTQDRKINILRDLTANAMGGAKVDRYAPSLTDNDLPNSDDSMAAVESSELSMGGDAVMNGKQNHVKHGDSHLTKAEQIEQAVQQGAMDPKHALTALTKLIQHAGEHLSELQNNPTRKGELDQLAERWDAIAKFTKQLQGEVEAAANQPNPEDKMSEDFQLGREKIHLDDARKREKDSLDSQRKFRKDALGERIADAKAAAQIVRQRATAGNGARPAKAA